MGRLKQKPRVMIAPTILGLYGLFIVATEGASGKGIVGLFIFLAIVAFWIVAFTVDPAKAKGQDK